MPSPSSIKHIQSLNGCLTSLRLFISRLAEGSLPFFQALKDAGRVKGITWTSACQEAFVSLKKYLSSLSIMSRPVPGEPFCLYLTIALEAVSSTCYGKIKISNILFIMSAMCYVTLKLDNQLLKRWHMHFC